MSDLKQRLLETMSSVKDELEKMTEEEAAIKSNPSRWSRKEILGHLIDSAINNLQRFTEVQFQPKPYHIRRYDQDALVLANDYQHSNFRDITRFWWAINQRIATLMGDQSEDTLKFDIKTTDDKLVDLNYLMSDYIDHMHHHLRQIQKYAD